MSNAIRIAIFSLAASAMAPAATYRFTLPVDATLNGQDLKAGEYKVDVNDTTAVIKSGKKSLEAKVKCEATARKFDATSVKYVQAGGKYNLQEIHLGGKKLNLVFEPAKSVNGGS